MGVLPYSLVLVLPLIPVSAEVTFTDPAQIEESTVFPMVVGLILINIARKENQTWSLFRDKLVPMMDSVLSGSYKTNIHLVVITDAWTLPGKYNEGPSCTDQSSLIIRGWLCDGQHCVLVYHYEPHTEGWIFPQEKIKTEKIIQSKVFLCGHR